MHRPRIGFALAISLIFPMPVQAQQQAADDVVVTGRKPLDSGEAVHVVRQITAATQGQIARFDAEVCPIAIGFTPEIEAQVVARMRRVAKAVGAEVAKAGCQGNVVLVVTTEGAALVEQLRSSRPGLFGGMQPADIRRVIDAGGPVRTWAATAVVSEDGRRLAAPRSGNLQDPPTLEVKTASFVNPSSRQIIDASTVVVDSGAVTGKTVLQLADYTMMRALARTRPVQGNDGFGTILTLFDSATPPQSVTETDVAYLKALYGMPGNRALSYQVSRIAKGVREASGTPADR